jgi:CubicO group peptidase (beta-lactamase class C family)
MVTPRPANRGLLLTLVTCLPLMLTMLTGACLGASQPTEPVRQYLEKEMAGRSIPGMQVAVIHHRKIVFLTAKGLANIDHRVPVIDNTVFSIASMTKAFTGVALLQLVERHQLDLAAPVSRYLDGLPPDWRIVTIRQLAAEISGLPSFVNNNTGQLIVDGDPEASWTKVQSLPLEFAPGNQVSYNQTNYALIGKVIDKVAGKPFTEFIKQEQFDVVGMPHTRFGNDGDPIPGTAKTYSSMRGGNRQLGRTAALHSISMDYPPILRTAAGIQSTAEDIAHWIIALQEGRLVKDKASLATMWTPVKPAHGEASPWVWSIGWPVLTRPLHSEYGASGGEKAALAIYPNDDLSVVILTNLQGASPEQLLDKVAAFFVPDLANTTGQ